MNKETYEAALEYLERALPNGVQIVAAALACVPPKESPALMQLVTLHDEYTKLLVRAAELASERNDAKADATRLREELIGARERICEIGVGEESDSPAVAKRLLGQSEDALGAIDAALTATDSGAWLAKHDAEVVKTERAKALEPKLYFSGDAAALAQAHIALTEKCATLEKQLVAATNDAARAELRIVDLDALVSAMESPHWCSVCSAKLGPQSHRPDCLLARHHRAVPDSDARLREVMETMWHMGATAGERGTLVADDIDEVLRGGA